MSSEINHKSDPDPLQIYQIRIRGQLDAGWTDWFEGMTISQEDNGFALLTGPVIDQSALHGLLKKIRDLGMPLLSVNRVGSENENASHDTQQLSQDVSEGELPIEQD
ncbi:MAG: hypothetical protein WCG34_11805 [Leptolinea sp.]